MLDYINRDDQAMQILNIEEQVPALNISLVYRNQELLTRGARLLADELVYMFTHPRAQRNDDY
ncbi:hypothetical protein [Pseudomonas putida]|uniref:hypothetical protein n=1 Tax=Pseudomonas putida TaxID=303 RepID=UPI0018D9FD8E|nr:hypothetical protein [Pseudomonas putida]MBH3415087.1 hypothetical protein [Pseudomonas putida]MDG9814979.1 hypothetical protein [Pseudomonas putida]